MSSFLRPGKRAVMLTESSSTPKKVRHCTGPALSPVLEECPGNRQRRGSFEGIRHTRHENHGPGNSHRDSGGCQ